jgi:hypothetical protein
MMYIDNEVLEKMIMTIVEGFDRIEKKLDRMGRVKEFLNGDELLDNYDIARLLNVSLRTVARYREKGLILCPTVAIYRGRRLLSYNPFHIRQVFLSEPRRFRLAGLRGREQRKPPVG